MGLSLSHLGWTTTAPECQQRYPKSFSGRLVLSHTCHAPFALHSSFPLFLLAESHEQSLYLHYTRLCCSVKAVSGQCQGGAPVKASRRNAHRLSLPSLKSVLVLQARSAARDDLE